jgi:hypothetical protein
VSSTVTNETLATAIATDSPRYFFRLRVASPE